MKIVLYSNFHGTEFIDYNCFELSPTNLHDKTKSTSLELRFTLTEIPQKGFLSIYSTDLQWGVIIPIFGNQSICRIVRAALGKFEVTLEPPWLASRFCPEIFYPLIVDRTKVNSPE